MRLLKTQRKLLKQHLNLLLKVTAGVGIIMLAISPFIVYTKCIGIHVYMA